jgi:hypothetical protein
VSVVDSGYYGSQQQDVIEVDEAATQPPSQHPDAEDPVDFYSSTPERGQRQSPARQTQDATVEIAAENAKTACSPAQIAKSSPANVKTMDHESTTPAGSPLYSPQTEISRASSPVVALPTSLAVEGDEQLVGPPEADTGTPDAALDETTRSPSDGSSPIRAVVRKSSLNFASLPAREPMKSIGARLSRTSHVDQNRKSYYNMTAGGKSLGNAKHEQTEEEDEDTDAEEADVAQKISVEPVDLDIAVAHNKTYTQRLQDQISKLGQSHPNGPRPSKSIAPAPAPAPTQQISSTSATAVLQSPPQQRPQPSPKTYSTPGAFPDDNDDDDWIEPLGPPDNASGAFSPRPVMMPKSHTMDVMEGTSGKETISGSDFSSPRMQKLRSPSDSPERPGTQSSITGGLGHQKSASVPTLPYVDELGHDGGSVKKAVSASNPGLPTVSEREAYNPHTPSKTRSHTHKESPLKSMQNKLSSILKSAKMQLVSSAAISAEGKSSLLSPSSTRLGIHAGASTMSLDQASRHDTQPLYPDLFQSATAAQEKAGTTSPRRTRASIEREKTEQKRREKEAREAQRIADDMEKLERARAQERERARIFSQEQERIAAMEKQVADVDEIC